MMYDSRSNKDKNYSSRIHPWNDFASPSQNPCKGIFFLRDWDGFIPIQIAPNWLCSHLSHLQHFCKIQKCFPDGVHIGVLNQWAWIQKICFMQNKGKILKKIDLGDTAIFLKTKCPNFVFVKHLFQMEHLTG